jgi:hypothetical protein
MDGPHFLAYVEQILAPTLKKGQIVFLDNVSTHKVDGVEEAIEARGARAVFLPAQSHRTTLPALKFRKTRFQSRDLGRPGRHQRNQLFLRRLGARTSSNP